MIWRMVNKHWLQLFKKSIFGRAGSLMLWGAYSLFSVHGFLMVAASPVSEHGL